MPKWPWQNKEGDKGEVEIDLPEDVKKQIEAGAKAATDIAEVKTKMSKLDSVTEFIDAFKAEREEVKKKQQQQQQQKQNEDQNAELEELWLTDPKKAAEIQNRPTNIALMTLRADTLKREVFEDEKAYPYYYGDIKKKVDTLLAGQSLQARNDRGAIENCYKTVVGELLPDILEGKIKNRWAGEGSGGRGTSSGSAGSGASGGETETPFDSLGQKEDIAKAAKLLGFKPDEYRKMLDQEGIGYV